MVIPGLARSDPSSRTSSGLSASSPTQPPIPPGPPSRRVSNMTAMASPPKTAPASPPPAPTNDDIEAVIQMAMATSTSSARTANPPRDTRTQLFVGNLPYRVRWQDVKDLFRRAGTVLRADVSLGPDNRSRGYGTVLLATAEDAGRAVDMFNGYVWQTRTLEVRADRLGEDVGAANMAAQAGLGQGNHLVGAGLGMGAGVGIVSPAPSLAASQLPSPMGRFPAQGLGAGLDAEDVLGAALGSPRAGIASVASPVGGAPSRNLFVGNLPFHIQWQDLKDLFRQAGAVLRADVALGQDGRSRGFGTVSFATEGDAERGVRMFNGYEFNGRQLKVHFDKFSAPASSAQFAVPVAGPSSLPHSPFGLGFHSAQPSPAHSHFAQSPAPSSQMQQPFSAAMFAQHILQQQQEQSMQRHSSDSGLYLGNGLGDDAQRGRPQEIAMPYRGTYFEFLASGPSTPYEYYGAPDAGMQSLLRNMDEQQAPHTTRPTTAGGFAAAAEDSPFGATLATSRPATSPQTEAYATEAAPSGFAHSHSHSSSNYGTQPGSAARSSSSQDSSQTQAPTQGQSQQRPHSQANHPHPAHPGPIALPPPPPVGAFPIPPHHTLSPSYVGMSPMHHPMSPMHPMMGMPMMTPHGLPPITPSMPSFTFLPQPSPDPASGGGGGPVYDYEGAGRAVLHGHVLTPYAPFSPGAALSPGMSPGAFWGRPGAHGNPLINPAVGAPVHAQYYAREEEREPGPKEEGYFPPVLASGADAGYFPPVPPNAVTRPSGLSNEIRGDDSSSGAGGSERALPRLAEGRRKSSDTSQTTAGTGTERTGESEATAWTAADGEDELAKRVESLAVEDGPADLDVYAAAKPRAYSAVGARAGGQMFVPSPPAPLQRADSDPLKQAESIHA